MFCPDCGTENLDKSKFCVKCGTKIEAPPTNHIAPTQPTAADAPKTPVASGPLPSQATPTVPRPVAHEPEKKATPWWLVIVGIAALAYLRSLFHH